MRVAFVDARQRDRLAGAEAPRRPVVAYPIRCRTAASATPCSRRARKHARAAIARRSPSSTCARAHPGTSPSRACTARCSRSARLGLAHRRARARRRSRFGRRRHARQCYRKSRRRLTLIMRRPSLPVAIFQPMNYNHQHHRSRRSRLIAEMRHQTGGGIAAIPTAPEVIRNADSHYPYRPDSHFYYLCGFPEPRGGRRAHRRARPTATRSRSCSAATRTSSARSGTDFATVPTPRAKSSASTRPIRSASSTRSWPSWTGDQPRDLHAAGALSRLGRRDHGDAERSAQSRAHRHRGPGNGGRRARAARRDAPPQGRARARAPAPRRGDLERARTAARWSARGPAGTNTRSKPS